MNTSCYAKVRKQKNVVSIAGYPPKWFKGESYPALAPKLWFFRKYKEDGDAIFYKQKYIEEVLSVLDPQKVYDDLGHDTIIVCWESGQAGVPHDKQENFCHRHIVAEWLENSLGITIPEL
jgi:hypothetical protein